MYFNNENHRAVTPKDTELLFGVCVALKSQLIAIEKEQKRNPKWRWDDVNCHCVARFISILFKELIVVDGMLIGADIDLKKSKASLKYTLHSWLKTPDGNIIDPYPMGVIATTTALLIPTSGTKYCAHGGNLYQEDYDISADFDSTKAWRDARSRIRSIKKSLTQDDFEKISDGLI
jgi:hypothetical protein